MFKEGDIVRVRKNCSGCVIGEEYIVYLHNGCLTLYCLTDENFINPLCQCQNDWEILRKNNIINQTENIMSNIVEFAKNLVLGENEKLLRKYGLKDQCGNYTQEAKEIVMSTMCKTNEEDLIKIALAKEEEENKSK